MKFKIIRSKLIEALKSVENIVSQKGSLPIIQNVLIEAKEKDIIFTTTDLDISIKSKVECDVIEEGSTTLPVKLLFNSMLKADECEVELSVDGNDKAKIKAGSSRIILNGKSAKEFPKFEQEEENTSYIISRQVLFEMLRKTSYASSQDDTRKTLKGVLMSFLDSKITMVATDGRRLALVEQEIEFSKISEKEIVLPAKTVQELQRTILGEGDVTIHVQPSKICFEFSGVQIFSKLIIDKYPNYHQVIPSESLEKITIDRKLLLNALERASIMTMDEAHSTKLKFSSNMLTVSSATSEIGEAKDEVPIKYTGETIDIIFNPSYLIDPLKAIDEDEIIINIKNGHSPAVIKCSLPFLYVLMPLRIN